MSMEPIIEIQEHLLRSMVLHARECDPDECCGILLGQDRGRKVVKEVFRTDNVYSRRGRGRDRYRIDGCDFLRVDRIAEEEGVEIIGFYHSHPGYTAIPSRADEALAWPGYSYLIVSMREGKAPECRSWVLDRNGTGWIEERIGDAGSEEAPGS